jgi:hypothetical protein
VQRTGKQHAATRRKEEDKSRLLAFVAEGLSIAEGLRQLGRPIRTYEEWRRTDTEWASRITTARLRRADKDLPGMEFVQFRSVFFGHETAPHHYRMIEAVERAEPDTITMILAFPEAAKTALMTDRVNHVLGSVNPNYRFCVISEGQDLARKIVGHVASRMTDEMQYGAYIKAYGPFRSPDRTRSNKPWNADYLQILGAANDEKEPSLEARGWGSKLYGGRYDEIILDDMQSSESLNQTPQMLRYLRQTVLTRPAKGVGKTIYVGSRVGVGDLPDVMVDEGMIDRLVTIPALKSWLDRDDHFYVDKQNKVHLVPDCPELATWNYWSMLQLAMRRRKVGEEIWARTYMQRQLADAGASFTEEMIEKVKDRDRVLGPTVQGTGRLMSIDPALDTGIAAFGMYAYSSNKLMMLDLLQREDCRRYEDIYSQIGLWAMKYRPAHVVIERNNFQAGMEYDDRLIELGRKFGFEIISHHTNRNKNDPVIGVKMMASAFIDGELSLPWGDEEATRKVGALCDELRNWRPKQKMRQDALMQLWFAWVFWEQQRQQMGLILPSLSGVPSWAKQSAGVPSWARGA